MKVSASVWEIANYQKQEIKFEPKEKKTSIFKVSSLSISTEIGNY